MRRWIGSMLAVLLVTIAPLAGAAPADEKGNDRATLFKDIQADYRKAVPNVQKALREAETTKEQEAILAKLNKKFVPRLLQLVEADPKDKLSFDMLIWAIQKLPNVDGKVFEMLAEHWSKDDQMKELCQFLMMDPNPAAEPLLQKVLDNNPSKEARGYACFTLGKIAATKANEGDKKADEAEQYFERVGKEFAKLNYGNEGKLGEQAKTALFEVRHLAIGKKAPNVESETLDGKKVQLRDYRGKVIVLDIWATWCPPCRGMIPHERDMVKKFKGKPFALISISADEEKKTLRDFIEKEPMPWTHWFNGGSGGILKDWNVQFFPTIYVLDGEGIIRYKNIRGQELEDAVEKLLAEGKK